MIVGSESSKQPPTRKKKNYTPLHGPRARGCARHRNDVSWERPAEAHDFPNLADGMSWDTSGLESIRATMGWLFLDCPSSVKHKRLEKQNWPPKRMSNGVKPSLPFEPFGNTKKETSNRRRKKNTTNCAPTPLYLRLTWEKLPLHDQLNACCLGIRDGFEDWPRTDAGPVEGRDSCPKVRPGAFSSIPNAIDP